MHIFFSNNRARIKLANFVRFVMPVFDVEEHLALQRLVQIAKRDTGQSRRVASFLLSWWDAEENGGFDLTDVWGLDDEIVADIVRVIQLVSKNAGRYPGAFELNDEFKAIIAQHR
jgi:hypothetical protein